jgi:hypothetical protein
MYGNNPHGTGFGWISDTNRFTGYGSDHSVFPTNWGYQDNYKPF